jgi:hypothetical protein
MDCIKCVLCGLSVVTFTYPVRIPWPLTSCVISDDVFGVTNIVLPYSRSGRSDLFSLLKRIFSAKIITLCYSNFYSAYGKRLEMRNFRTIPERRREREKAGFRLLVRVMRHTANYTIMRHTANYTIMRHTANYTIMRHTDYTIMRHTDYTIMRHTANYTIRQ